MNIPAQVELNFPQKLLYVSFSKIMQGNCKYYGPQKGKIRPFECYNLKGLKFISVFPWDLFLGDTCPLLWQNGGHLDDFRGQNLSLAAKSCI